MNRAFVLFAAVTLWSLPAFADEAQVALPGGQDVMVPAGGVLGLEGPGVGLRLTEVTDQRCPSQLDCYWEGMIRVVLEASAGGVTQTLILCNECEDGTRSGTAAGYVITLARLDPVTELVEGLGRPPVLADYTAIVTLSAN